MRFFGRLKRSKQGVGSIIGAVFVILILLSGLTFYATYLSITDDYYETVGSMGDLGWSQNQERIAIKQVRLTAANNLNLTVENQGAVQSHLIWLGIFNKSAVPENQGYYALDEHLNPSESRDIVSGFTVVQDLKYAVQLVTELGNIVQNTFYPASAVRCALSLTAASPTTYEGNNVTVMLTVTPNDTEVDTVQSLTANISAAPTGLVQPADNSPLTVSGLAKGESAFFWWTYNTIGTGTVTFNATYGSAPAGTYALTDVNILASPGQGGGGNVSVAGVNGTAEYNPSQWNLLGSTQFVSGTLLDLQADNGTYMTFGSYQTASSAQTLYAHGETVNIGGTPYYLQKLTVADGPVTTLSSSMGTVGNQPWGNFTYPLAGVTSIPASTWTTTYRAWRDSDPAIAFDSASSVEANATAASASWNHTTGTGYNRLLLVAVGVHVATGTPTTVTNVTYGGLLLTQVTTALYSSTNPQVRTYIFSLTNPASGINTIKVTFAVSTLYVCGAVTYSGVDQTTPIQTSNTATGSGTSQSVSVTVSGAGRAVFGYLGGHRTAAWTITEGSGQDIRWSRQANLYKGRGSDKLGVSAGSVSMNWTTNQAPNWVCSAVVINPATVAGYANLNILIRKSDNTVRTTIATNAAGSVNLTTTPSTITGAYSWPGYTVVDQTDYLEIDYYVQVTTAASGVNAYLRIDDPSLGIVDQTKTSNIMLPSEYTVEAEFSGTSITQSWTQLTWTIDSSFTATGVATTFQLYNYTAPGAYSSSGDGFMNDTIGTANVTKIQTITISPTQFRDVAGTWRVKIRGVKSTSTQFLMKVDWIDLQTKYPTTGGTIPYNAWQWYSLRATTASGDPIPYAYVSIYANGTSVTFSARARLRLRNMASSAKSSSKN